MMPFPELAFSPRVLQTSVRERYPTWRRGLISSGPADLTQLDAALVRPLLGQELQTDLAQDLLGSVQAHPSHVAVTQPWQPAPLAMETRPQWVAAQS